MVVGAEFCTSNSKICIFISRGGYFYRFKLVTAPLPMEIIKLQNALPEIILRIRIIWWHKVPARAIVIVRRSRCYRRSFLMHYMMMLLGNHMLLLLHMVVMMIVMVRGDFVIVHGVVIFMINNFTFHHQNSEKLTIFFDRKNYRKIFKIFLPKKFNRTDTVFDQFFSYFFSYRSTP